MSHNNGIRDKNRRIKNLTGQRFGRLVVVERNGSYSSYYGKCVRATWKCKCDCGNEKIATTHDLTSGHTTSCGCLSKETRKRKRLIVPVSRTREEWEILRKNWCGIIQRCYNPNHPEYHRYGGRGIRICDEWRNSSKNFIEWAFSNGFEKGLTIDRIDNDKGYEPSNCRYITRSENAKNTCRSHYITISGITLSQADWSRFAYGNSYRLSKLKTRKGEKLAILDLKENLKKFDYAQ